MSSAAHTSLAGRLDNLTIDVGVEGGRAVLVLRGDLIHGCADTLATALARLPDGTDRVDLDMTGVAFMDTTGLRFLEVLDTYGRRRRVRGRASAWNAQPRRVLEMAGLDPDDPLHGPGTRREPVPSAVV